MLTEGRRIAADRKALAREAQRRAECARARAVRQRNLLDPLHVSHLLIGQGARVSIDRRAWDAGCAQSVEHLPHGAGRKLVLEGLLQHRLVLRAQRSRRKARIGSQIARPSASQVARHRPSLPAAIAK